MAQLVVAAAGAVIGGMVGGPMGAKIGWMAGSMIGGAVFGEKAEGPKIQDGTYTSSAYGTAIPLNYGTDRHSAHILWWSGLNVRTEEVGGKFDKGGAEVEKARMSLLLSVCEGPQAAVLRIWANGRLIATNNGGGFTLDEEVLPAGEVRVYLGTEDQMPDPTYEAAVGVENAVPYRGEVIVMIDGLEGEQFANRPPNIEVEVAQSVDVVACPLDPFASTPVQQAGLFLGSNGSWSQASSAAAFDTANGLYYVVTDGADGSTRQLEVYSVTGAAPALASVTALPQWRLASSHLFVGGMAFDPENGIVRIAAGHTQTESNYAGRPIEYMYMGGALIPSAAKFTINSTWGNFPVNGQVGGNGARYGVVYAIYPNSGSPQGEAGWWSPATAIIQYRLAHLVNGTQGDSTQRGWHLSSNEGRWNVTADVLYVPRADGAGGYNIAWEWDTWRGRIDTEAVITDIGGADGTDGTNRWTALVHAPRREKVYIVAGRGIASIDVSFAGNPNVLASDLATIDGLTFDPSFSVWNEKANSLILGRVGGGKTTMVAINPDTGAVVAGPCTYPVAEAIRAPRDLGDGRFVCVYGSDKVAIVQMPGGTATGQPVTLRSIVEDVCKRAPLPPENLDATAGTDLVAGFKVARQATGRQIIDSLRPGYFFDMPEIGTKLVLVKRGAPAVATIESGELGAHVFQLTQNGPEPDYELEHIEPSNEAPRTLELQYVDATANYDPGLQRAERQTGQSAAPARIELPVVLSDNEAARIAWVNLLLAHAANKPIKIKLTHHYGALVPSDAIEIPHASGRVVRVRVDQLVHARPLIEIDGVIEDAEIYTQTMGGVPRYQGPRQSGSGQIGHTALVLLDVPPLRDEDDLLVVYAALAPAIRDQVWPGATLYKSLDGGSSYSAQVSVSGAATVGRAVSMLGDWTGGNRWDDENTVDVLLSSGTFSSATDAAVLNGANAVAVAAGDDWEVVQFTTAELVGANTWRLSRLLRGRKGTERCIVGHAPGDRVVLLSQSLRLHAPTMAEIGSQRQYKGVTAGQAVADAATQALAIEGRSLMPLSPAHVQAVRETSNDITISWFRRARINADWPWNGSDIPLDEPTETYEIEVLDGATVKRTLAVSSTSVLYTQAQQLTDFGALPTDLDVRVYQISSRIGRGWPGDGSLVDLPAYSYEPGQPSGGDVPPPVAINDRLLGRPLWWAGKWWSAPENSATAVDLGAAADQFSPTGIAKWAADKYRDRLQMQSQFPGGGNYYVTRRTTEGVQWVAGSGDILCGIFRDDAAIVNESTFAEGNKHIQWWSPSWSGPKFARRSGAAAGEGTWWTGAPGADALHYLTGGATDGTKWVFLVEPPSGNPFLVSTEDYATFTQHNLSLPNADGMGVFKPRIMHNGSKWVLFWTHFNLSSRISSSSDLVTWTAEANPPYANIFSWDNVARKNTVVENVAFWNGAWYYFHDYTATGIAVRVYRSADLIAWTLVHTCAIATGLVNVRMIHATAGKLQRLTGSVIVSTTDGTTWAESFVGYDGLEEMARGLALPFMSQTLPAEGAFATQGTIGEGGALLTLNGFDDASPSFAYQPVTSAGAGTMISGGRTIGSIEKSGRVATDFDGEVKLLRAFTTGKRYLEVRILRKPAKTGTYLVDRRWVSVGIDYGVEGGAAHLHPAFVQVPGGWTDFDSTEHTNVGDVISMAADFDAHRVEFRVNNARIYPMPPPSAFEFAMVADAITHAGYVSMGYGGGSVEIIGRAADCVYAPPNGYTGWDD